MFGKLADIILKNSKAIIAFWIVVLVCALPLGIKAGDVMEYDLTKMVGSDSESGTGQKILDEYYSNSVDMSMILVVSYDNADSTLNAVNAQTLISDFSQRIASEYEGKLETTIVGNYSGEGHTTGVILVAISTSDEDFSLLSETGNIRSILSDAKEDTELDYTTYVTGNDALTYDTMSSSEDDVAKVDPISVFLIIVLLGLFFFALVTAAVPPLGVGVAYGVSLLAMYIVGNMMGVYYLTQTLVLVTMLGAGCDYGIFIVTRYREELKRGAEHDEALKVAIEWAGESVFTSGLAVIIGFGALAICDFTMVRTMGIVLAIGIVLALIVALTLIPSVVNLLKGRIFWPTKVEKYISIEKGEATGFYAKLCYVSKRYFEFVSRFTRRFAIPIVVVALVICVPTFYVYATTGDSYDMISIEPESEAKDGLNAIMEETYGGTLMPTYVIIELDGPAVAATGSFTYAGTSIPYVVWTPAALTVNADGTATGYVPALMVLSNEIAANHSDIIATASGPTSWYCLFMSAVQQSVVPAVTQQVIAQYQAMNVVPTQEQIAQGVQAALPLALTPEVVSQINHAIYARLGEVSSSLQQGVGMVLTLYSGSQTNWTAMPDAASPAVPGLKMMNIIDGLINVKTGLINIDASGTVGAGTYATIMIVTNERPMSDNTMALIEDLHDEFHGEGGYDEKLASVYSESYVTGKSAAMDDISETVSQQFKVIEIVVVILLVILLFVILRCYLTPIRAILNILMSVIWTIALTHFVFGSMLDIPVCWVVPIVLFVVLLGLGMDYDIFLTTRVREYKLKGHTNHEAVEMAIRNAGPTITLCALIMGGTFLSLLVANSSMLREFGFALGVGILIDGLFMVTYVVPSLMHLMGEASWKGPEAMNKPVKLGRGFAASQGMLAATIMIVFFGLSVLVTGAASDAIDMQFLMDYDKYSRLFAQLAFGLGGLVLMVFGFVLARTNPDAYGKLSGVLYIAASAAMILAAFAEFDGIDSEHVWTAAFGIAVAAALSYSAFLITRKHALGAGLMGVILLALVGAALAGALELSFGLGWGAVLSVVAVALCEAADLD